MRYIWCAIGAGARLFTIGAWLLLGMLAASIAQAATVSYTTKGLIFLSCDGAEVSRHSVETEMSERALRYAVEHGGKASCVVAYPDKTVVFDIPLTAPPVEPPPACPPKPADETRIAQCPAGTAGSWTQTQSYGSVAYPTCWVPSGYIPSAAPAGACTPTPAALVAPTNLKATVAPNRANPANSDVTLTWDAVVGATGYDVDRCTGANCASFAIIASPTAATYVNTGLPPGLTFKYGVRAKNTAATGPWVLTPLTVTTPTAPVATGTATLEWTPPTQNTDGTPTTLAGFRIRYSTVGDAGPSLSQTIDVNNGAVTTYEVDGLTAGPWAFAVEAYDTQGRTSQLSDTAFKTIQ